MSAPAHDLVGRENLITLHTCGKALGAEGALLCAPAIVRDFLVNRGRPFIFSTAPSPLMAWLVHQALEIVANEPERAARLHGLVRHTETRLARLGLPASGSQIFPVVIGDNARTMRIAAALQADGFDIRGIRPPTVAPGTARLRPVTTAAIVLPPDTHPVIRWLATYAPYVVRKDFISWGALVLAAVHLTQITFGLLVVGGVLSATVVTIDHVRARLQLSELRRRELSLVR